MSCINIGNIKIFGIIYKITNTINGKVYIGQTSNEKGFNGRYYHSGVGVEKVYKYHNSRKKCGLDYNSHLLNSIEKYGFETFEVNECFDVAFSQEELDIKEISYIQLYNSYKNGYNNTLGGGGSKGRPVSQETRDKIGKANKNRVWTESQRAEAGKRSKKRWEDDEEYRQKMAERFKGENHPCYGKPRSEESKQKQREAMTGRYKGSNSPAAKAIYCYELNEIRLCAKDWCKELGLNGGKVSEVCSGKRKHTKGYHFRFATQEEIEKYKEEKIIKEGK